MATISSKTFTLKRRRDIADTALWVFEMPSSKGGGKWVLHISRKTWEIKAFRVYPRDPKMKHAFGYSYQISNRIAAAMLHSLRGPDGVDLL